MNLETRFAEQMKHMIGITAQLHDDKISPILMNHPFKQLVNLNENENILLADLQHELIAGEKSAVVGTIAQSHYLLIRPKYQFGLPAGRHKYIDKLDNILWEDRVYKSD